MFKFKMEFVGSRFMHHQGELYNSHQYE